MANRVRVGKGPMESDKGTRREFEFLKNQSWILYYFIN